MQQVLERAHVMPAGLFKKIYNVLDELQKDLDDWLYYYNHERTPQGKMCCGRTPMQTFLEGKTVWDEKVSSLNLH
jgi:hypothetical protein